MNKSEILKNAEIYFKSDKGRVSIWATQDGHYFDGEHDANRHTQRNNLNAPFLITPDDYKKKVAIKKEVKEKVSKKVEEQPNENKATKVTNKK